MIFAQFSRKLVGSYSKNNSYSLQFLSIPLSPFHIFHIIQRIYTEECIFTSLWLYSSVRAQLKDLNGITYIYKVMVIFVRRSTPTQYFMLVLFLNNISKAPVCDGIYQYFTQEYRFKQKETRPGTINDPPTHPRCHGVGA